MKSLRRRSAHVLAAATMLAACSSAPQGAVDAAIGDDGGEGGEDVSADRDAHPSCSSPTSASFKLGSVGATFDPNVGIASDGRRVVVGWKRYEQKEGDRLELASAAAGASPATPVSLDDETTALSLGTPVIATLAGEGFVVTWNARTAEAELAHEVRWLALGADGKPVGEAKVVGKPEALVSSSAIIAGEQPLLWTVGAEKVGEEMLSGRDLSKLDKPPIWKVKPNVKQLEPKTLRFVRTDEGYAALYERKDGEGVFFERLSKNPARVGSAGVRVGETPGLERWVRSSGDRIVLGVEDFVYTDADEIQLRNRIGVLVLDRNGSLIAETILYEVEGNSYEMDSLAYYGTNLLFDDEIQVWWAVSRTDGVNVVLDLYRARLSAADGRPIGEPEKLGTLDQHRADYPAFEEFHSGSVVTIEKVGNHVAVVYSVGLHGPYPGETNAGGFIRSDLYLQWFCLD